MIPRVAICLPSAPTPSGARMLRRSILALHAQDCDPSLFEVVVGVDGAGALEMLDALGPMPRAPFDLTFAGSRRTRGAEGVPHRNHARNAAWKSAKAPLCWMLDADFILPPHAVRHVTAEHDAAMSRGAPAIMSPCLWQFGGASTEQWWERSAAWSETGAADAFQALLSSWPDWDRGTFSGFGDRATGLPAEAGPPASVSVGDRMIEGMPVLWRGFLAAIGGFDEAYVGWGGDKIALVDVLKGLAREGVVDIRVLTSVVAVHQPHATDPAHTDARSAANEKRRRLALMPIQSRTLEWKRRVPVLVDALRRGWGGAGAPDVRSPDPQDLAPVLETVTPMVRRRLRPGAVAVCMGQHAGALRSHLERVDIPVGEDAKAPHAVLVAIDALDAASGWRHGVEALGHALRSVAHPTASVVLAQRLDGPGLDGLQASHLQTQVVRRSMDARTIRVGAARYTVMCGRL